jgi:ubiquinone/menaquinone biosynthesis C-methylase UbiE
MIDVLIPIAILFAFIVLLKYTRGEKCVSNRGDCFRHINLVHLKTGIEKQTLMAHMHEGEKKFFQAVSELTYPQHDNHETNIKELLIFLGIKGKTRVYADICSGDGEFSKNIAEYLELSKGNVYNVDYHTWLGCSNIVDVNISNLDHLPNDHVDLSTCMQTFHRLSDENSQQILEQLYRITKEGGYLIVREHNTSRKMLRYMYILQELVFKKVAIEKLSLSHLCDQLILHPKNKSDLHHMIESANFRQVLSWNPSPSNNKNPADTYYSIYIK